MICQLHIHTYIFEKTNNTLSGFGLKLKYVDISISIELYFWQHAKIMYIIWSHRERESDKTMSIQTTKKTSGIFKLVNKWFFEKNFSINTFKTHSFQRKLGRVSVPGVGTIRISLFKPFTIHSGIIKKTLIYSDSKCCLNSLIASWTRCASLAFQF